jgi:hypothetical protein
MLVAQLERLRASSGRPHWILVDDAEHLLPSSAPEESLPLPAQLDRMVLITETPRRLSNRALKQIDTLAIVGERPHELLAEFCESAGRVIPSLSDAPLSAGEVLYWRLNETSGPTRVRVATHRQTASLDTGHSSTTKLPPSSHAATTLAR